METKHRYLSDEEFLRLCSDKRHQSPIIEELCQRLEEYIGVDKPDPGDKEITIDNVQYKCEVCEAEFSINADQLSNNLILTFKKG